MLEKEPFVNYKTQEEKEKEKDTREVFSISLNAEERLWLNDLKQTLNIKSDGKALKVSAFIGRNVLHNVFGDGFLKYLFSKERTKFEDLEK